MTSSAPQPHVGCSGALTWRWLNFMNDRDAIVQRLVDRLAYVSKLRATGKKAARASSRRLALRAWQAARLARTHADLLESPHFGSAAAFFLADIYDLKDLSKRDAAIKRIVPIMTKLLPTAGLETVADAVDLDALTESLDAEMVAVLGSKVSALDGASYGQAYRTVDRRADRERQILLINHLGHALNRLAHQPLIGSTLAMMRLPARLMGLGDLQDLLERGYDSLSGIGDVEVFLRLIMSRERRLMKALFAGDDSLLDQAAHATRKTGSPAQ